MNNTGIVVGYVISSWMDYHRMPFVAIGLTCLFLSIFVWFPDSPDYLEHKNRLVEAKKSYEFYGNFRVAPTLENPKGDAEKPEQVINANAANDQKITWEDFKVTAVRRGIVISVILIIFADTSAVFAIAHFMTELFEAAKMTIDIYVATIVVGCIQILGNGTSMILVDRFGRRVLFMVSAMGTGISLLVFGGYYFLLDRPEYADLVAQIQWLPLVSLSFFIFIASVAMASLPFFVISELMPVKVRGFVVTLCFVVSWVFAWGLLQFFHLMMDGMGIAGTMWTFAVCCFTSVVFVFVYLPETRNLTFDQIQDKLRNKRV